MSIYLQIILYVKNLTESTFTLTGKHLNIFRFSKNRCSLSSKHKTNTGTGALVAKDQATNTDIDNLLQI